MNEICMILLTDIDTGEVYLKTTDVTTVLDKREEYSTRGLLVSITIYTSNGGQVTI